MAEIAPTEGFVPAFGNGAPKEPVPMVEPAPQFLLKAHPERWTVMDGQVIPSLAKLLLVSGVNNCLWNARTKSWHWHPTKAQSEERGWTIIPVDAVPPKHIAPGQPKSYLCNPKGRPDVFATIYTRFYPGSKQQDVDTVRYLEFCQHLETAGYIQPPPVYVLEKMLEEYTNRLAKAHAKSQANPQYRQTTPILEKAVAGIRKRLEGRKSDLPPADIEPVANFDEGSEWLDTASFFEPSESTLPAPPVKSPKPRRRRTSPAPEPTTTEPTTTEPPGFVEGGND